MKQLALSFWMVSLASFAMGLSYDSVSRGGGASAMSDLTDVNIPTPGDNEALTYDTASGKWVSEAVARLTARTTPID